MRSLVPAMMFLVLSAPARAAIEVEVTRPTTEALLVGDRTIITLGIKMPAEVTLPSAPQTLLTTAVQKSGLEVLDLQGEVRKPSKDLVEHVVSTTVSAYTTGTFVIPGFEIPYVTGGKKETIQTAELSIRVKSLLPGNGPLDIRGPGAPEAFQPRLPQWVYWLAAGLVGFVVLLVIFLRGRKRETIAPPPMPPYEEAMLRLGELLAEHLPEKGMVKEHCDRLSDIVRWFLTRQGLATMDLTSDELMERIRPRPLPLGAADQLQKLLATCDQAKFARFEPGSRMVVELDDDARAFVTLMKPRPVGADGGMASGPRPPGTDGEGRPSSEPRDPRDTRSTDRETTHGAQ